MEITRYNNKKIKEEAIEITEKQYKNMILEKNIENQDIKQFLLDINMLKLEIKLNKSIIL